MVPFLKILILDILLLSGGWAVRCLAARHHLKPPLPRNPRNLGKVLTQQRWASLQRKKAYKQKYRTNE